MTGKIGVGEGSGAGADGPTGYALVYTTFPAAEAAEAAAEGLVAAGLIACANIIPGMRSVYAWEGQIERSVEVSVIFKTRAGLVERVVAEVIRRHPYAVPAVVAVPIVGGNSSFLAWIDAQTGAAGSD